MRRWRAAPLLSSLPLGLLGLLALIALLNACRRAEESAPRPQPSEVPAPDDSVARAVGSVLADVRSRLSVAAPAWQLQPLAFGQRILVRLRADRFEVHSVPELTLRYQQTLAGPRGVVALAGGSVLVIGESAAFRVDPDSRRAVELAALAWVPGSVLLPERRDPGLVWGVQRGGRLFVQQKLVKKSERAADEPLTLEGYDGGPVAALRDAAFLYASSDGVRRAMPRGRPVVYRPNFVPWRLLPAPRVDQAWAVADDGAVERVQLGDRWFVAARLSLGAPPIDVAANRDHLAAVVVDERGAERRFRLLVFSNEGERVLERPLAPGPPATGEGWAELAVRDRNVVLSDSEPIVAVGGPGALEVLHLPDGAARTL